MDICGPKPIGWFGAPLSVGGEKLIAILQNIFGFEGNKDPSNIVLLEHWE